MNRTPEDIIESVLREHRGTAPSMTGKIMRELNLAGFRITDTLSPLIWLEYNPHATDEGGHPRWDNAPAGTIKILETEYEDEQGEVIITFLREKYGTDARP